MQIDPRIFIFSCSTFMERRARDRVMTPIISQSSVIGHLFYISAENINPLHSRGDSHSLKGLKKKILNFFILHIDLCNKYFKPLTSNVLYSGQRFMAV